MKPILLAVAVAGLALSAATPAEAGPRFSRSHSRGHSWGGGFGHGYVSPSFHHDHYGPAYCAPVHRIRTVEVGRHCYFRTAYLSCGRPFTQRVTVVTYCDHFSNGTTRTWTRTFY